MTRDERMRLVRVQYAVQHQITLPEEIVVMVVYWWETTGCCPEFLEGASNQVINSYQPLYEVAMKVIRKASR